jgi:hypothetical protein
VIDHLSVVFKASIRERIGPRHQVTVNVPMADLPLMGFDLLMGCTPPGAEASASPPSRFTA